MKTHASKNNGTDRARPVMRGNTLAVRSWRTLKLVYYRIIRSNQSPRDIAGGVALGTFVGVLPTASIAMVICLWAAPMLGVNTPAAILATWMANPWTYPMLYIGGERLGAFLLNRTSSLSATGVMNLVRSISRFWAWTPPRTSGGGPASLRAVILTLQNLYLGTAVLGLMLASIMYWLTLRLVTRYRTNMSKRKNAGKNERNKQQCIPDRKTGGCLD